MSVWCTCSDGFPKVNEPVLFLTHDSCDVHEGRLLHYGDMDYFQDEETEAIYRPGEIFGWRSRTEREAVEGDQPIAKELPEEKRVDNQEAKADAGKLDPTLVPSEFIWAAAAIRRYGTKKYGSPENWKRVSVERYRSAAYRHWLRYLADPHGVDEESGYPHLWHWICNAAFIAELEKDYLKKYYETNKEEQKL